MAKAAAVNNQVLVFVGDKNVFTVPGEHNTLMFKMMMSLAKLKVRNVLLVALDKVGFEHAQRWVKFASKHDFPLHVIELDVETAGPLKNIEIRVQQSAKKFPIVRDLLKCDVDVLISDFDVLFWEDPFKHIHGDADVEAMTDGWDYMTAFGSETPVEAPGWHAPWEQRVEVLNSGFFYVRASNRTVTAMAATWDLMCKVRYWDQAAFNGQIHAPLGTGDGGSYNGQALRLRVMNMYLFPNSRVFHTTIDPKTASSFYLPPPDYTPTGRKWPTRWNRPVAMHVNYHTHKVQMMAFAERVIDALQHAPKALNGGGAPKALHKRSAPRALHSGNASEASREGSASKAAPESA